MQTGNVHVVDDDPSVRDGLQWLIESIGMRAVSHANAEDFLGVYDGSGPACLVTDLRMPGMSGLDLQAALAERGWTLPVILITAYGTIPIAVTALQNGAID